MQPKARPPDLVQLLGVAFASADLAFEVANGGAITFVAGATKQVLGVDVDKVVGRSWHEFLDPDDARVVSQILADIKPGERRGGICLRSLSGAKDRAGTGGELSVFRQPFVGAGLSCVFRRTPIDAPTPAVTDGPLLGRSEFDALSRMLMQEAAAVGSTLHLDLLETSGFAAASARLSTAEAKDARRDLIEVLRVTAHGGFAATELATDRFALVRSADTRLPMERLSAITGVQVKAATSPLSADAEPNLNLRAIRVALDRHIEAGPAAAADGFRTALQTILQRAQALREAVQQGHIELVFQPIVHLTTRRLHHFEALARFDDGTHPEDTIRLAEELDMITAFDAAVFASVVETLRGEATAQIAVNLSGRSLVEPGMVDSLLALTAAQPELRKRLIIEITETHALKALDAANDLIGQLQAGGHTVCLDDFGAGAASLDYLRLLNVDVVKIDGRYIRTLTEAPRDRVIVQHVVNMCRDLGIAVIAEMIENEETARAVMRMGAALGQGWLFGKATPSLQWPTPSLPQGGDRSQPLEALEPARRIWTAG